MVRQTQKGFPLQSMDHFGRQSVSHCSADASHTSDDHGAADDDHDNYDDYDYKVFAAHPSNDHNATGDDQYNLDSILSISEFTILSV